MSTPQEWHHETIGLKVVEALKKNNFTAEYVSSKEDARKRLLELIPQDVSVGIGGSMTTKELNVLDELESRGNEVINHGKPGLKPEEKLEVCRKELTCDCFLTSANAITMGGKIVNVDGMGNRVAASIYGPKKVIMVAGINKITKDLDSALERIENMVAPMNSKRLGFANPCTKTGVCVDCQSPTRICNVTTIMHKKPMMTDVTLIIVGEELGY